jgi:hypothetical protein
VCLIFIHFCLYYLNIDIFKLSNNTMSNTMSNNTITNVNTSSNTIDVIDIEESINQLKNLNNYIDNGPKNTTLC